MASHPHLRRLAGAVLLGAFLFLLHSAGVISGALAPPPGYEPAWVLRNLDTPQYLTWLSAARDHIFVPNYHAPWQTEPALWQPLMLLAARSGLPELAGYYLLHLLLYIGAAYALLYAMSVFCPGRETWFAFAAAAATVPFRLIGWMLVSGSGSIKWLAIFVGGLTDYGYSTADGLFRGGISNSPMLTVGTLFMLATMALLARYLETGDRKYWIRLCGATFLSAFVHPFEIFCIVPAALVSMASQGRIRQWFAVAGAGLIGLTPYFALSIRSPWLRDTGEIVQSSFHPFWVLADFGIPCVLAVYLILLRFRMPTISDRVLQAWFFCAPLLLLVPGIPFPLHMLNGYAYCVGMILVRRLACDYQILPLLKRSPRASYGVFAGAMAVSVAAIAVLFVQVWKDGRKAEPMWLISAVRSKEERALLDWIQTHTAPDALVLSPPEISVWVAGIPRPSFASHDFFSITFPHQRELTDEFYQGKESGRKLLEDYGVRIAVVPIASPVAKQLPPEALRNTIGQWQVYEFPNAKMKPYPGLAALDPTRVLSQRHHVFTWLAKEF